MLEKTTSATGSSRSKERATTTGGNDTMKPTNIVFYFTSIARTWLVNHETEFHSWAPFKSHALKVFGKPTSCKHAAENKKISASNPADRWDIHLIRLGYLSSVHPPLTKTWQNAVSFNPCSKIVSEEAFRILVVVQPETVPCFSEGCLRLQEDEPCHSLLFYNLIRFYIVELLKDPWKGKKKNFLTV